MGSEGHNNNTEEENLLPGGGGEKGVADEDGKPTSEEEEDTKSTVTTTTAYKDTSSSEATSDDLNLGLSLLRITLPITISACQKFPNHPRTKPTIPSVSSVTTTPSNQIVGWPPVRGNRMNNLNTKRNNAKNIILEEVKPKPDKKKVDKSFFVIVDMDGTSVGRKVDLNAHTSYESLGATLNQMFANWLDAGDTNNGLRLLDGSSEYMLTYEDREGDWMLVGDVPWGYFLSTVRKLRIMRTDEMVGLAPCFERQD